MGGKEAEGGEKADYGQQVRSSFGDQRRKKAIVELVTAIAN